METVIDNIYMQIFDTELLCYLAQRYNRTPHEIVLKFLILDNLLTSTQFDEKLSNMDFMLENNELEILRAYYKIYDRDGNHESSREDLYCQQ